MLFYYYYSLLSVFEDMEHKVTQHAKAIFQVLFIGRTAIHIHTCIVGLCGQCYQIIGGMGFL